MASSDKAALESRVLSGPAPACVSAGVIDFKETEVKEYADYFAMVINGILTPEECAELISLVQPADNTPWPPATMTAYNGSQILDTSSRHCGRIIYNSKAVADRLLNRILPHLPPEVATLDNVPDITGQMPVIRKEKWKISRLSEALKLLKYEPGNYFRPHCDAHYEDKETGEKSLLTAPFYFNGGNGGEDSVEGGATRFVVDFANPNAGKVDANPKTGSVLIFQQRDMYHEGAGVDKGVKYTMRADIMYKKV
ncbi:hypothetical protein DL769_007234 [Monosporascus sp. CRB-8-3]|nr:hypothetical protein DL769_007234 [Monosporascus sp. CRB-8-3]